MGNLTSVPENPKNSPLPGANIQGLPLRFEAPDFEKRFRDERVASSKKQAKVWAISAMSVFASQGLVEWFLVPDRIELAFFLRFGVCGPLFFLFYVLVFHFNYERFLTPVISISMVFAWLATLIMFVETGYPVNEYYSYLYSLFILFMYAYMGVLLIYTAPMCWLFTAIFLVAWGVEGSVPLTIAGLLPIVSVPIVNIVGMFIAYNYEVALRRTYRAGQLILVQQAKERDLQSQLRNSQKMEAVGQIAGGVAHEFNNMLQIILHSADFVREKLRKGESAEEYIVTIEKTANRSAELTGQLLTFSRSTPVTLRALNLNDLTRNLIKMVRPMLGEEVEVEFQPSENLHRVMGDQSLLQRAILNLCVNARDAMPMGGRIILETRNHRADQDFCDRLGLKAPGDCAVLSVTDFGTGIAADIHERIFEPFFTTKEVGKGTGLGLSVVHGIIQQHQGGIEAVSDAGKGTTFSIFLPMTAAEEIEAQPLARAKSLDGEETILLAEDDEEVLKSLTKSLENNGYRVLTAKDGIEGLSEFKANFDRIDLVILDMVMPKMSGRRVYEEIHKLAPDLPVLFSTGYSTKTADAEFLAELDIQVIRKPYTSEELLAAVRELLD